MQSLFNSKTKRLSNPTRTSSRKRRRFDWMCESTLFSTGCANRHFFRLDVRVGFCSVKQMFEPIASSIPPHRHTRPHTHTRYHTASSYNSADACLAAISAAASRRKSRGTFLAPPASSVYHTMAERGIDGIIKTMATFAAALEALGWGQRHGRSFGGFRLRPTPTTRSDEGSLRMKHALLEEGTNRAFYRLSTAIQQNSHQPPPEQKSSVKSTPLTISRRPRIIHSKKAYE